MVAELAVEVPGLAAEVVRVVNGTVITLVVAYTLVFVAIWMPTASFYDGQAAFVSTLGDSASIILASVVALAIAQHLDVRLFSNLKS